MTSRPPAHRSDERITVLFMQTQTFFGADSQIHSSIARHLDPERFRVIVACNNDGGQGSAALDRFNEFPNVEVRPTDFGPTRAGRSTREMLADIARRTSFLRDLVRLARYARANHVRIVHGTEKPRDVLYGHAIARICGAKSVVLVHVKVEDWIRPITRRVMRHVDALVGVSAFVQQSAIDFGYRPERTHHVLNALEIDEWQPDRVDGRPVLRELGLDDDAVIVSIIARVFPWKGHELLLRALALVHGRGLRVHLLIVGDDDPRATPDGGSHTADLRLLASELGLEEWVHFMGFRSDIPRIMAASDIFAMPSYEEPFGMVFLEAMAMHAPVVACNSGGVVEFIEDGVTGLLSDPGDVDGLADNLARLITDPDLRTRLGDTGRSKVLESFTSQRMADDFAELYTRLLTPNDDSAAS